MLMLLRLISSAAQRKVNSGLKTHLVLASGKLVLQKGDKRFVFNLKMNELTAKRERCYVGSVLVMFYNTEPRKVLMR